MATRAPLTDLEQWRILTRRQVDHYLRTYRFLGLLAFIAFVATLTFALQVAAGAALLLQLDLHLVTEYLGNFLEFVPLWVILAAGLFGGDALSTDFSTGTGFFLLVQPIRRSTLLAGRYAAATLVTLVLIGVYYGFALVGAAYFYGAATIPWTGVALSLGLSTLFIVATLGVAFTFSAFFKSPAAGVLVTVLTLYAGFTTLQDVTELAGFEPWWSLNYAGGAIFSIIDTNFQHYQSVPAGHGQFFTNWTTTPLEGAIIMVAYLAAFLILSAVLYHRQEST